MQVEDFDDRPTHNPSSPFLDRLSLKRVDRDIFTGWCHAGSPLRAFGGQVAAQALVAAGTTVEQPGRRLNSLHSYFLRAGRTTDHIVYLVDRPRDGRSFSTRRVKAVQYGETIFTMSASFATPQEGPSHEASFSTTDGSDWIRRVPKPDELSRVDVLAHVETARTRRDPKRDQELQEAGFPGRGLIDLRIVNHEHVRGLDCGRWDQMAWIRTHEQLPDDNLVHECALTYFSDLTLVGTVLGHHGGRSAGRNRDLASIDHAMWFHRTFRADKWVLFVTDSPFSGEGHGFARGEFFTRSGQLIASAAQEVLVRDRDPKTS
jgi:acyl-CoA thioesterase-2